MPDAEDENITQSDEDGNSEGEGTTSGSTTNTSFYPTVTVSTTMQSGSVNVSSINAKEDTPIQISISVSGFLKKEVLKITNVGAGNIASAEMQEGFILNPDGTASPIMVVSAANVGRTYPVSLWSIGAWGGVQGYPCACAMYQDRLILAGSNYQPQTIWMSRTGDYADFSTSDPLRDDDAVNITLAGSGADGIHSLLAGGDILAFTNGGEWRIKGSGDSGAITPTALAAHQQTNIGTKDIQPLTAGGHVILVQSQGRKVYALGYDLNTDGYTGSELTILSGHIFEGKEIVCMAYQKEPDSLLWFVLSDGTCAVCTYNPEHEVIGWSRQEFTGGSVKAIAAMNGASKTEILLEYDGETNNMMAYLKDRTADAGYNDGGSSFESRMRTLRLNAGSEDGSAYTSEKLTARLIISALRTTGGWAAPGDYSDKNAWERRRRFEMDYEEYLQDVEIQLDNGFSTDACIQIRSMEDKPLTIAGITPILTVGG